MFWHKNRKTFFDFFDEHAAVINSSALLLEQLLSQDSLKVSIAAKIKECEHKADEITHEVIKQMNTASFILPLDREDILAMTKALDDVIDYINHSAQAFAEIYQLDYSTSFANQFGNIIVEGSQFLVKTCLLLRSPSKNSAQILQNCIEIHRIENLGDDIRRGALKSLYGRLKSNEIDLPSYLAWDEIYCTLEIITDKAEDCANIAEQIVMKYS